MKALSALLALLLVAVAVAEDGLRHEERRNFVVLLPGENAHSSSDSGKIGLLQHPSSDISSSEKQELKVANRIARNAQEEIARQARKAAQEALKKTITLPNGQDAVKTFFNRKAYQAKFTRDSVTGCTQFTQFGTPPVNTRTTCSALEIGPMVIVAKTSLGKVEADVFDGDKDGKLDVVEALEQLERVNGTLSFRSLDTDPAPAEQVDRLADFVLQIRNRALVNGGSIHLTSLILTGRVGGALGTVPVPYEPGNQNFLTFGANKTLVSPCFPVVLDPNFNIDIYGPVKGFFSLARVDANAPTTPAVFDSIPGTLFFDGGNYQQGFTSAASVGPFPIVLTRPLADTVGGNRLVTGTTNNIATMGNPQVGTVVFEPCAQFSYFQ